MVVSEMGILKEALARCFGACRCGDGLWSAKDRHYITSLCSSRAGVARNFFAGGIAAIGPEEVDSTRHAVAEPPRVMGPRRRDR